MLQWGVLIKSQRLESRETKQFLRQEAAIGWDLDWYARWTLDARDESEDSMPSSL